MVIAKKNTVRKNISPESSIFSKDSWNRSEDNKEEFNYDFKPLVSFGEEKSRWILIRELFSDSYASYELDLEIPNEWFKLENQEKLKEFIVKEALKRSKGEEYSPLLEKYEDFLEFFLKVDKDLKTNDVKVEILENMNKSGDRIFREEQINEVRQDKKSIEEIILEVIARNLDILAHNKKNLKGVTLVLGREKTRKLLDLLLEKEPFKFALSFSDIYSFYSPEESKEIFKKMVETEPHVVLGIFDIPEIQNLFSKEEIREMLLIAENEASFISYNNNLFALYLEKGYMNKDDVKKIFSKRLKEEITEGSCGDSVIKIIPAVLGYLNETEKKEMIQELTDASLSEKTRFSIFEIMEIDEGLMDLDKKRKILITILEKDLSIVGDIVDKDKAEYILGKEKFKEYYGKWIRMVLDEGKINQFSFGFEIAEILESDMLSETDKKEFAKEIFDNRPSVVLQITDVFLSKFKEEEREEKLQSLLSRSSVDSKFYNFDQWIGYIPKKERKSFLTEMIRSENSFAFLQTYYFNKAFKEYFTKEEIELLFKEQIELGSVNLVTDSSLMQYGRDILGNDIKFKEVIEKIRKSNFECFIISLNYTNYLYGSDELELIFKEAIKTERNGDSIIINIDIWASNFSKEVIWDIIKAIKEEQSTYILVFLKKILKYVPEKERKVLIEESIQNNPFAALYNIEEIRSFLPEASAKKITVDAKKDSSRFSFMPKTLTDIFKRLEKENNPETINSLIGQGGEIYQKILAIKNSSLEEDYKKIQNNEKIIAKKEEELLSIFYCLSLLKKRASFNEKNIGNSLEELKVFLFKEINKLIKSDLKEDSVSADQFLATMHSPTSFLIYYLQYDSSPEHQVILKEIFENLSTNKFDNWRFGGDSIENLEQLKEKGYVPKKLTLEQYQSWRKDEETSTYETLASDAEAISAEIKKILLENNQEHLKIEAFYDVNDISELTERLSEIQENLRLLGQELAPINKRFGELKKKDLSKIEQEELEELKIKRKEFSDQKRLLTKNLNFLKLALLTPEEIASGHLLKDNDLSKRGETLEKVVKLASSLVSAEASFVFKRLNDLLISFKTQGVEKQNLTCIDTTNAKITLEIGEKPVQSCQSYRSGGYNSCLLGYFSHNTKILALKNENGNLVARSIFRLLEDDDGNPHLHMELVYSAAASSVIKEIFLKHALKKAEKMKIDLFIGRNIEESEKNEFNFEKSGVTLFSNGSRAPKVYVDSAGGEQSWGRYRIASLLKVKNKK